MNHKEKAKKIVQEIVNNLTRRKGYESVWYGTDEDIRKEIIKTWEGIVEGVLKNETDYL